MRRQPPPKEADATAQQQATTDNSAAVSTLQSTVSDLKINAVSLATTVSMRPTDQQEGDQHPTNAALQGHHSYTRRLRGG